MLVLSANGVALIKEFEGCRLEAYQDQGGVWTIGYGHTGPEVVEGLTCSQLQADTWLLGDTHNASYAVITRVDVLINQNQFDALVSFVFNVGIPAFEGSTLLRQLNMGHTLLAADEFVKWDHIGGVPNLGLLRRRQAEQALFLTA